MDSLHFISPLAYQIWDSKYRLRVGDRVFDDTVVDTWRRVATALAEAEIIEQVAWQRRFFRTLDEFRFLPGGRIQASAGTERRNTLFNCFVMGTLEDSIDGIFEALKEGALTLQQGGGTGYDFSTLRPRGTSAQQTANVASGPLSFMRVWDSMCATIQATGARRGAMMATLACDHPDIEAFIDAKRDPAELRHFNLSVLVTDDFMRAVAEDAPWPLVFPKQPAGESPGEVIHRPTSAEGVLQPWHVYRTIRARELWERLLRASYDCAEPGVIFIDQVRRSNNLRYCETIHATNPCGEIPLPAYGACDLGSLNLTRFVLGSFTDRAELDWVGLRGSVTLAVRMLDNVYDISVFPLAKQREVALASRRIGLGITGLADALIMLGLEYGSEAALRLAERVMSEICHSAYRASIALAMEKGSFPAFVADHYLRSEFIAALPEDIRSGIAKHGIRNSHLTAIAPAGTISLLANNVSSGLEPVFAAEYGRWIRAADGSRQCTQAVDYAVAQYRKLSGTHGLPRAFVSAAQAEPETQLHLQAALQKHVDNAISKTIVMPADFGYARFRALFETAYRLKLKGCTAFRPNAVTGSVLVEPSIHRISSCCPALQEGHDEAREPPYRSTPLL
jgi:ribonucleoside-diphosphate reductase alpha chain